MHVATERIQPTNQGAVGMHRAAFRAEEHASAGRCLLQRVAGALLGELGAKLGRSPADATRWASDLIGIELDALVMATARAAPTGVAEGLLTRAAGALALIWLKQPPWVRDSAMMWAGTCASCIIKL
jgi:hypothetical protein